jgi:hypothetical protein
MPWLRTVLLLVVVPPTLSASTPTSFYRYDGICHGNLFATCASVTMRTYAAPGGHTYMELEIRNLEGQLFQATDPWGPIYINFGAIQPGKRIAGATFSYPDDHSQLVRTKAGGFLSWEFRGPVGGTEPVLGVGWDELCDPNAPPAWFVDCSRVSDTMFLFPQIHGCTKLVPWYAQTCQQQGFTGSVVFRFDFAIPVLTKDLFVTLHGVDGACTLIGNRPDSDCQVVLPATVSPEPSTWVLMATGLVALGIVARRGQLRRSSGRPY